MPINRDFLEYARTHGLPPAMRGNSGAFSQFEEEEDEQAKVQHQINNYKQRINYTGNQVPEENDKTNKFIKALQWLDKPRNAVWNALDDARRGENGLIQGFKEGWSGEEQYTGQDLMKDLGIQNKFAKGIGGFVTEAVLDPLNLATFGAGSLAKGALTGVGKTMSKEGAEALAKGVLKNATKESVEALAKRGGREIAEEALPNVLKHLSYKQADDVLKQAGLKLGERSAYGSADEVLSDAVKKWSKNYIDVQAKNPGRGLSIGGKTIGGLTNTRLQDIGAKGAKALRENVPIVGDVVGVLQDSAGKIFNPRWITGVDDSLRRVYGTLNTRKGGNYALMNEQLEKQTKNFSDRIGKTADPDVTRQLIRDYLDKPKGMSIDLENQLSRNPEALSIAQEMEQIFKQWGDTENLGEMMENYFPRVGNWENESLRRSKKLGGITGNARIQNVAKAERGYKGTFEDANLQKLFNTSSEESRARFLEEIGVKVDSEVKRKIDLDTLKKAEDVMMQRHRNAGGKAVDDVYDLLDGVDDFFEADPIRAFISRGLQHNKVLADTEFLDEATRAFGERVTRKNMYEKIDEGYQIIVPKSSFRTLGVDFGEFQKMLDARNIHLNEMGETVADFGEVLSKSEQATNSIIKRAMETQGEFIKASPEELDILLANRMPVEAYAMEPGIVEKITGAKNRQLDEGFRALTNVIDGFHRFWKPTVTGLRPDFHIRNLTGSTLQNIYDIGFRTLDPTINSNANKVARMTDDIIDLGKGVKMTAREVHDEMTRRQAFTTFQRSDTLSPEHLVGKHVEGFKPKNIKQIPGKISQVGAKAGDVIEDRVRSVNFLANVQKGLDQEMTISQAMDFASEQVKKWHFDYTDLTGTEKQIFRRLMPFYTWSRKNMPLQLEELFNNPARYARFEKFGRNVTDAYGVDTENMPEWLESELPIPAPFLDKMLGKKEGDPSTLLNLSMPPADISRIGDMKDLVNMLSPMLKYPIEATSNQQLFTGAPIYSNEYEKNEKLLEHALNQFGIARDVARTVTPPSSEGKAVSQAFNLPGNMLSSVVKNFDPYEAETDAMYDYNRQLGNYVQYLNSQGSGVPNVNTVRKMEELAPILATLPPELQEYIKQTGEIPPHIIRQIEDMSRRG